LMDHCKGAASSRCKEGHCRRRRTARVRRADNSPCPPGCRAPRGVPECRGARVRFPRRVVEFAVKGTVDRHAFRNLILGAERGQARAVVGIESNHQRIPARAAWRRAERRIRPLCAIARCCRDCRSCKGTSAPLMLSNSMNSDGHRPLRSRPAMIHDLGNDHRPTLGPELAPPGSRIRGQRTSPTGCWSHKDQKKRVFGAPKS